jgi:hypothetical protein
MYLLSYRDRDNERYFSAYNKDGELVEFITVDEVAKKRLTKAIQKKVDRETKLKIEVAEIGKIYDVAKWRKMK